MRRSKYFVVYDRGAILTLIMPGYDEPDFGELGGVEAMKGFIVEGEVVGGEESISEGYALDGEFFPDADDEAIAELDKHFAVQDRSHLPEEESDENGVEPEDDSYATNPDRSMKEWMGFAACRGTRELFIVDTTDSRNEQARKTIAMAVGVCATCPVLKPCFEHAVTRREEFDIWGGTLAEDRLRVRSACLQGRIVLEDILNLPQEELVVFLSAIHLTPAVLKYWIDKGMFKHHKEVETLLDGLSGIHKKSIKLHAEAKSQESKKPKPPMLELMHNTDALDQTDEYIRILEPYNAPQQLILWDDQAACLEATEEAALAGLTNILFQMSPSRGKTTVVGAAIQREIERDPDIQTVGFFCHSKDLLEQAIKRFQQIFGRDHSYEILGEQPVGNLQEGIRFIFAPFQLLHKRQNEYPPDMFDIVAIDEAHRSRAPTFEAIVNYFRPKRRYAMTATLKRLDTKDAQELFGPAVFTQSLADTLSDPSTPQLIYKMFAADDDNLLEEHGISPEQIDKKIFIQQREEKIAELIAEELKAHGKENARILVFANTQKHADRMAKVLPNAKSWHGNNRHTIKGFREGKFSTLTTVELGIEGLDISDIEVIVFLGKSNSPGRLVQQIGRGLRMCEGKDSLLALDFAANCDRLLMVEDLMDELVSIEELLAIPDRAVLDDVYEYLDPPSPKRLPQRQAHNPQGSSPPNSEIPGERSKGRFRDSRFASVRTFHNAQFEFTPTVVKISERLRALQDEILPDGTVSVVAYCETRAISPQLLHRLLKDMGVTKLPRFRINDTMGLGIVPELQERLDVLPEVATGPPPEGILSIPATATQLGMYPGTVIKIMEAEGIDVDSLSRYKFGSVIAAGTTPEVRARIMNSPLFAEYLPPQEDEMSRERTAKELGVHKSRVDRAIDELDLQLVKRQVHTGPVLVTNAAHRQRMREHLGLTVQSALETDATVRKYADSRGVHRKVVDRLVEKYDLELEIKLVGNIAMPVISEEGQAFLDANYPGFSAAPAPEGWESIKHITVELSVARKRFEKAMERCDVKPTIYRFGRKAVPGISPEDKATVQAYLEAHPERLY